MNTKVNINEQKSPIITSFGDRFAPSQLCEIILDIGFSAAIRIGKEFDSSFFLYALSQNSNNAFSSYLKFCNKVVDFQRIIFPVVLSEKEYHDYLNEVERRRRNLKDRFSNPN